LKARLESSQRRDLCYGVDALINGQKEYQKRVRHAELTWQVEKTK